ncbi:hypothetical protein [Sphingomonas sp. IC-11]|uniref:hypothetical protein n=1 Tax=Sphingomonas sp. IC-11 TaxID=2898528 RepID=UPI003FA7C32A
MPATTTAFPAGLSERDRLTGGALDGIMPGATTRRTLGWYGPRPSKGDKPHRYRFQLLAAGADLFWLRVSWRAAMRSRPALKPRRYRYAARLEQTRQVRAVKVSRQARRARSRFPLCEPHQSPPPRT